MIRIVVFVMMVKFVVCGNILPLVEEKIIREVAQQYKLCEHKTNLLISIRRVENGRAGLEFGVGDGIRNHPARRYANSFECSLRLQAEWAAGTIKKRYDGDLIKFAKRYCPPNWRVWTNNVNYYMSKQEVEKIYSQNVSVKEKPISHILSDGLVDADTINLNISTDMF